MHGLPCLIEQFSKKHYDYTYSPTICLLSAFDEEASCLSSEFVVRNLAQRFCEARLVERDSFGASPWSRLFYFSPSFSPLFSPSLVLCRVFLSFHHRPDCSVRLLTNELDHFSILAVA